VGATTIATTHYNPLKTWASQADGVLNASVEFDEVTLRPTYRLIVGVAGASAGLDIARRMRIPNHIIEQATSLLDPAHTQASDYLKQLKKLVDEQEGLRSALEEERQVTAEKYARLDLDFAQREAERQRSFENQLAQVIRDFSAESARLLRSIDDRVTAVRLKKETDARTAELRRSAGVRLRKQIETAPVPAAHAPSVVVNAPAEPIDGLQFDASEIHERDRVRIKSLDQEGTVESINDGEYTVLVGSLRFRAKRDEIRLVQAAAPPASKHAAVSVDSSFTPEINVIGATVDQATDRVDKFLDEAYMAGAEIVRIVHGHGKGTLRRAIAELLTGHTHVERFNPAPSNEGGTGATIVALKK
jgi:DNA mismatch repair protein MutS2